MTADVQNAAILVDAVDALIPVTVKTRLGWDCENKIITDLGPRLQDCGIKALTEQLLLRFRTQQLNARFAEIGNTLEERRRGEMTADVQNAAILVDADLGPRLQDCGIKALTVHGRTRSQMYTGQADWSLIGELKNDPRMEIPVIGNGDITSPEGAAEALSDY